MKKYIALIFTCTVYFSSAQGWLENLHLPTEIIFTNDENDIRITAYRDSILLFESTYYQNPNNGRIYSDFKQYELTGKKIDTFRIDNNFKISKKEFYAAKKRLKNPKCFLLNRSEIFNATTHKTIQIYAQYCYLPPKFIVLYKSVCTSKIATQALFIPVKPAPDSLSKTWEITNAGLKILCYKDYNFKIVKQQIYSMDNKLIKIE